MADIERGQRIKTRREELGLSQPEVVDEIERLAWALPTTNRLHPDYPKLKDEDARSKAPVTLRGYQTWESGGGIDPGKAKLLAAALQTDTRALINGVDPDAPTPTPFAGQDSISGKLDQILTNQAELLHRLDALEHALTHAFDESAARVAEGVAEAQRVLRAAVPGQRAADPKPAPKRTKAA